MRPEKVNILGVNVSAVNMKRTLDIIDQWIAAQHSNYVCLRDVHGVMICQKDTSFKDIHNVAGLVVPDGMPLVWVSRLLGFGYVERVCGPDLMLALCKNSIEKGHRHYFYGGAEGVSESLASNLQRQFPGLTVVGTFSPPFRPLSDKEDAEVVEMIKQAKPDIVWVGLSTPKQEYWMSDHIDQLPSCVLLGVGAAFDFHAGTKKRAPVWMRRCGMEWLFRLINEPRRLWKRYLILAPIFTFQIARQLFGRRHKTALEQGK